MLLEIKDQRIPGGLKVRELIKCHCTFVFFYSFFVFDLFVHNIVGVIPIVLRFCL